MNICSWYQGLSKTIWILGCRTDDHYPRWLFVGSRTCIQYFSIQNFRPLLLWSWLVLTTVMDIAKYKNRFSPSLDGLRSGGCSGNALAPGMLLHICLSRRKPTLRSWRKEGICLLLWRRICWGLPPFLWGIALLWSSSGRKFRGWLSPFLDLLLFLSMTPWNQGLF